MAIEKSGCRAADARELTVGMIVRQNGPSERRDSNWSEPHAACATPRTLRPPPQPISLTADATVQVDEVSAAAHTRGRTRRRHPWATTSTQ